MSASCTPKPSPAGVCCFDLDTMVDFHAGVFGTRLTGRGHGAAFLPAFRSGQADPHPPLAWAPNRPAGAPGTVTQRSLQVQALNALREARTRVLERGASRMRGLHHGNALTIDAMDPGEDTVEVALDPPRCVAQPHGHPLHLAGPNGQSDSP